jgi:hypothetical protein
MIIVGRYIASPQRPQRQSPLEPRETLHALVTFITSACR